MAEKKWFSEDGTDIRVTLPDGGVAIVGDKPRTLPKKFWKAAVKEGALATDQNVTRADLSAVGEGDEAETRRKAIYDLMLAAWDASENDENTDSKFDDAFTGAGKPNVRWLEKELGFDIDGTERDEIWAQVQDENSEPEADSEGDESQQ